MGEVVAFQRPRGGQAPQGQAVPGDGELVAAILAGKPAAREQLFRRHYPRVLKLSFRLLGREDDAEDLAQDVCVIALRDLHKLRDSSTFASWLTRICVLRARSRIRHYRVLRRLHLTPGRTVDPDQVVGGSVPPEVGVELATLYRHLHQLSADVRIALVLRRVEGRSVEEIAALMGRSPATVKRRIADGHEQLQGLCRRPT